VPGVGSVSGGTDAAASNGTATVSGRSGVRRIGAGLVALPATSERTRAGPGAELTIPEAKRTCRECGGPVGRSRGGEPARATGYCAACRHPFSFAPPLDPGDVVNNQYEILRCLALGGLGWVYLAKDRMVADRLVVLKGMIDSTDPAKVQLSIAERQFLAGVNHPNIVRIHNFVYHDAGHGDRSGYIVMEYVVGQSLKDVLAHRWASAGPHDPLLPLEHALGYVLDILPAFSYLHGLGLLYCDFKPDNIIDAGDRVILVDLGAVRWADDDTSDFFGTRGYQAPELSEGQTPTVESDLYTVGRTLAVLSTKFAHQTTHELTLPDRHEVPLLAANQSFHRLLARATAADPARRFSSAEAMYDQVLGVLRETLAANGPPQPGTSRLFTGERRARLSPAREETGPDVHDLPTPRVDPTDPASAYLDAITVHDPEALLALLDQAPQRTVEVEYASLRAELRAVATTAGDLGAARTRLERIGRTYGSDWRQEWFSGVLALAEGQPDRARPVFERLYDLLPGELAVKLALAMSEELAGRPNQAAGLYDLVCRTDPSYTTACTGLARCRLAMGDQRGAVEAYQRVPATSAGYRVAQVSAIHALLRHGGPDPAQLVEPDDLREAGALIGALEGPPAERAQLRAALLEALLHSVRAGAAVPASDLDIADTTESGVRAELERCYRTMASYARGLDRVDLVDRANAVRPWTRI
jgi:serine/threonine-protein kinase PknG